MTTSHREIHCEVSEGIFTITLSRPEQLNTFTDIMREELVSALDSVDSDDAVRAVIVTGAGRAFCAGADLAGGASSFDYADPRWRDGGGQVSLRIFNCKKPVIGAINGAAVGVGVTMTLPMDLRIASTDARFGFVFARRGVVPEACSTWFLPRVVGISQALDWVLSGRMFPASEAKASGLVHEVLAPDLLLARARALARSIADQTSAVSVAMARQMLWRMLGAPHPAEAHRIESAAMRQLGKAADAYEGVSAFLEKRPAHFSMKPTTDMPAIYPWWEERDLR